MRIHADTTLMSVLKWSEEYSVKVSEMDTQHKRLFELINQLHEAMSEGKGNDTLVSVLHGLKEYTITHFTLEEQYMEKFKYPGLAEQKRQHLTFVKKIDEYEEQLKGRRLGLSIDVFNFLRDWLINHIKTVDGKYSEVFYNNGLL